MTSGELVIPSSGSSDALVIGAAGTGSLTVSGDAVVKFGTATEGALVIGRDNGSDGTVTMTGGRIEAYVNSDLVIGEGSGASAYFKLSGGTLDLGSLSGENGDDMTVSNGTLHLVGRNWTNIVDDDLFVGPNGTVQFDFDSISRLGTISIGDDLDLNDATLTISNPVDIVGGRYVIITGDASTVVSGTFTTTNWLGGTTGVVVYGTSYVAIDVNPDMDILGTNKSVIADGDATPDQSNGANFKLVYIGNNRDHVFTITNNTPGIALQLTGNPLVSTSGTHAADFHVISVPSDTNLLYGESTTFTVRFSPNAAGERTATIIVSNNTTDVNPYDFAIIGTGEVAEANIEVRGTNMAYVMHEDFVTNITDGTDFGQLDVDATGISHQFTITNAGPGSLQLTAASPDFVTVSGSAAFSVTTQPSSTNIPAGTTNIFIIEFDPSSTGTHTALVQIANNDADRTPYKFAIAGVAIDEEISIRGTNHNEITDGSTSPTAPLGTDFGSVLDTATKDHIFSITNIGTGPLYLTDSSPIVSIGGAHSGDFILQSDAGSTTIVAGARTQFTVRFDPVTAGVRTAEVSVANSDSDENPYNFRIIGTATGPAPPVVSAVVDDGAEAMDLTWTRNGNNDDVIILRGTAAATHSPTNGDDYTVGNSIGNATVIFNGSQEFFKDVELSEGTSYYYSFFSVSGMTNYSTSVSDNDNTTSYPLGTPVEPFSYTLGDQLDGKSGGDSWSSGWDDDAPEATDVALTAITSAFTTITGYPTVHGHSVAGDPGADQKTLAFRDIAAKSSGSIYASFMVRRSTAAANEYVGLSFFDSGGEELFFGKYGTAAFDGVGIEEFGTANKSSTDDLFGKDTNYLIIAKYDFTASQADLLIYAEGDTVPETEPGSWTETITGIGAITEIDRIRIASGGFSGADPGQTRFDEVRIATNWTELLTDVNYEFDDGGTGHGWEDIFNWSSDIEPVADANAYVNGNYTSVVSQAGEVALSLFVGSSSSPLTGSNPTGTVQVIDGTLTLSSNLFLGFTQGDKGSFLITNGKLAVTNDDIVVGQAGLGIMTVTGTAVVTMNSSAGNSGDHLRIGDGSSGGAEDNGSTLYMGGSATFTVGDSIYIGRLQGGDGSIVMAGGLLDVPGWAWIGNATDSTGVVTMTAGELNIQNGHIVLGHNGLGRMMISGTATVDVSNTAGNDIIVGNNSGTTNTLDVSGSALVDIADDLILGTNAAGAWGAVNLAGSATISVGDDAYIGERAGATGVVTVSGGTLSVGNDLYVGNAGDGTLTVNGGYVHVTGDDLIISDESGSTGILTVSSGSIDVTDDIVVGSGTLGTMTVSGGGVTGATLRVSDVSGADGSVVNVSDGRLYLTEAVDAENAGTINISGGELSADTWDIAQFGDATVNINVSGGTLTSRGAFTLGNGSGERGVVTQTGGTVDLQGIANIGASEAGAEGVYTITNGTLTTDGNLLIGHSGGTGTGVFHVVGTNASITVGDTGDEDFTMSAAGELFFTFTGDDMTLINVQDDITAAGTISFSNTTEITAGTYMLVTGLQAGSVRSGTFTATNWYGNQMGTIVYGADYIAVTLENVPVYEFDDEAAGHDWSTAVNWTQDTEPISTADAWVNGSYTAVVSVASEVASNLYVGSSDAPTTGDNPTGTVQIISGDLTLSGDLVLGANQGDVGRFVMTNGTLNVPNEDIIVGQAGLGNMTVTGSAVIAMTAGANDNLLIGDGNTSGGAEDSGSTLYMGGNAQFTVGDDVRLGRLPGGHGSIVMSGGLLQLQAGPSFMYVGDGDGGAGGATGIVTITGGEINLADGNLIVGHTDARGYMSISGNATVAVNNVSAGPAFGDFFIGNDSGETNTVVISGNALLSIDDDLIMGDDAGAQGILNISGDATVTVGDFFRVGDNADSTGTVSMTGGNLTVGTNVLIGNEGDGTFTMSAGTFTDNGDFNIGNGAGSIGVFVQTGGTVDVNGATSQLRIGTEGVGAAAYYTISGGTIDIEDDLQIGDSSDGGTSVFHVVGSSQTVTVGDNLDIDAFKSDLRLTFDSGGFNPISVGGSILLDGALSISNTAPIVGGTHVIITSATTAVGSERFADTNWLNGVTGLVEYVGNHVQITFETEMDVLGTNIALGISSGDTTPTKSDGSDFGSVGIGSTKDHIFTITNTSAFVLQLTGSPVVNFSGSGASAFSLQGSVTTNIGAGAATTFTIRFSPGASGVATATVSIANNDSDENPYTFTIQGRGAKSIDGDDGDWIGIAPTIDNSATISSNEFIWKDKNDEERKDLADTDPNDLQQFRVAADSDTVYFYFKPRAIDGTDYDRLLFAIGVDTNRYTGDGEMNWIADDGSTSMGAGYYTNGNAAMHYPDKQIMIHNVNGTGTRIELYDGLGGSPAWFSPPTLGNTTVSFSDPNDFAEFAIARADLGLSGSVTARFTIATYSKTNLTQWANDADITHDFTVSDAIDSMSIVPYGQNDASGDMSSYDEDIGDGDIDFYLDIRFDANGLAANTLPTTPDLSLTDGTVFPTNNAVLEAGSMSFNWPQATDADDEVTSYFFELSTNASFNGGENGTIKYRANTYFDTTYLPDISSVFGSATTFYWRVRARDLSGMLSGVQTNVFHLHSDGDDDTAGPVPELIFVGTNWLAVGGVRTNITDAEAADTNNPIDIVVRWTDPSGVFMTNHTPYLSTNILSNLGRVVPNWDLFSTNVSSGATEPFGYDAAFTNFATANGDLSVTTWQGRAFSVTNLDAQLTNILFFLTVSAEDEDDDRSTFADPQGDGDNIPYDRYVTTNYMLQFGIIDDDSTNPVLTNSVSGQFFDVIMDSGSNLTPVSGTGTNIVYYIYDGDLNITNWGTSASANSELLNTNFTDYIGDNADEWTESGNNIARWTSTAGNQLNPPGSGGGLDFDLYNSDAYVEIYQDVA
ncbi:MAG: choice-of-anchor D domain-containing protein, partial [Verrucomicrobia bacterium]|nr:choice-of-anchor D domain-containing protein [Verrucomicrobiota bacterium]